MTTDLIVETADLSTLAAEHIKNPDLRHAAQSMLRSIRLIEIADGRIPKDDQPLIMTLTQAASAWVDMAVSKDIPGQPKIDLLDPVEAFKGLVLVEAARRFPNDLEAVKKGFLLLGKEATVKSRNHTATYDREYEKVLLLYAMLGVKPPSAAETPPRSGRGGGRAA